MTSEARRVRQWSTFARTWWLFDANHQCPFKSSYIIAHYLQGKHKPIWHPRSNVGDHVIVINTKWVAMKGTLWRTWIYFDHKGYPGTFTKTRAYMLHDLNPTKVMEKAVYAALPSTLGRKNNMARLHLFPEEEVPEDLLRNVSDQIPQPMMVPKRLDEYTPEEIANFPKLFDWPEDYIFKKGQRNIPDEEIT